MKKEGIFLNQNVVCWYCVTIKPSYLMWFAYNHPPPEKNTLLVVERQATESFETSSSYLPILKHIPHFRQHQASTLRAFFWPDISKT